MKAYKPKICPILQRKKAPIEKETIPNNVFHNFFMKIPYHMCYNLSI